ncbi:MAG: tRNA preQ1(34) S-adenosylmethionine ribosyltransferase-isomerase QueA [Opitutales bacterium]
MNTADLDFDLPPDRIAQHPVEPRDASRLLVYCRATGKVTHTRFRAIGDHLPPRSQLFRNDARVLSARLPGRRPTGGRVECLLLKPLQPDGLVWECLLKPGRKLTPGATFAHAGSYTAQVLNGPGEAGVFSVRFHLPEATTLPALADRIGQVPLPPYIRRGGEAEHPQPGRPADAVRYQTVYANPNRTVAAAAPTAGLHFTSELLDNLETAGHRFHDLTLHVGLGTFRPIQGERLEDHKMHAESYEIPEATRAAWASASPPDASGARIGVGTTSLRALEDAWRKAGGRVPPPAEPAHQAEADLFIYPPARIGSLDGLITNFHLPRSTLIALVAAFLKPGSTGGIPALKALYREAIDRNYRFFSYGDAMLIL